MSTPRLHLLGLPHTQLTEQYLSCAYSQKIVKFCKMMGKDYPITLYAGERVEVEGIEEHVECVSEAERSSWFGDGFNTVTTPLRWDPAEPYWQRFAARAIPALRARARTGDLLLVIGGNCQQPISDAVPQLLPVEWGVGYEGIYTSFCAFESYAWMHHVYGLRGIVNGRAFDQVIPNYFDANDFLPARKPGREYLVFLGRVTQRKGPHVAGEIAKRLGMKLLIAGPGATQDALGPVVGDAVTVTGDVRYVGEVNKAQRAELLANATACIVPTLYNEPFGGVAIEALMSGCPVVASDWGAFTETVTPNVGRRFRTLRQGVEAVEAVRDLDREAIAADARARFSLEAVRPRFKAWFEQLSTLWGEGYYA